MNYVFQFGDVWAAWRDLLWGCWLTIQLSAAAMLLGLLVAVFGALDKTMGPKPVRRAVDANVEVIRNASLLVQIFLILFGLPRASASCGSTMLCITHEMGLRGVSHIV
jgi:polar amino acid transport system permease protein